MASAGFDATDTAVIDLAMTLWTNFAKTGNPSIAGRLNWPAYTPANDSFVEIAPTPLVRSGLSTVFP
jgi:para-nitrobenzyl esterase